MSTQEQVTHAQPLTRTQQVSQSRPNIRWRTDLAGLGFVLPFLIAYVLFLVWPIILGLRMSFFNWSLVGRGTDQFLGLANYEEALRDSNFWSSLWHTIIFTVISTPVLILIGLGLALLANRAIPAKALFRIIFFAPYVLPVSVVVLIWNWLYQPGFGLVDNALTSIGLPAINWLTSPNAAMAAIIILTIWWTVGFNFVLYLAGMQQIPHELYEAASIDGAGGWAQVRRITIPLLTSSTTLILILQIIASLQVFSQIYLLTAGGPNYSTRPVIEYIYDSGFTSFRVGFASAMSYLLFIIILVVSVVQFTLLLRQRKEVAR